MDREAEVCRTHTCAEAKIDGAVPGRECGLEGDSWPPSLWTDAPPSARRCPATEWSALTKASTALVCCTFIFGFVCPSRPHCDAGISRYRHC